MIRVSVEIWPRGDRARAREIARIDIGSISDRASARDYEIWASSDASSLSGRPAFEASGMTVRHRRKDSIWALLAKATGSVASQQQ